MQSCGPPGIEFETNALGVRVALTSALSMGVDRRAQKCFSAIYSSVN